MNSSDDFLFSTNTESSSMITTQDYETEILNTATTQFINDNDSTQDTLTVINTMFDHVGSDITDDITEIDIDNDYIFTTLPSVINNSLDDSEDLDIIDNKSFTNFTNIVNETDYIYRNENITYLLNNSSEISSKTDITEAPQSIINNTFSDSDNLDTIDNEPFINSTENSLIADITEALQSVEYNSKNENISYLINKSTESYLKADITEAPQSTEYNSKNENITYLINNSTESYLIADITEVPQSTGIISLNGSINNIINSTVNEDHLSLFTNPLNSTTTNLVSNITVEFNNNNNESFIFPLNKSVTNNITSEIFQNKNYIEKSNYGDTVSYTNWTDNGVVIEDLLQVSYHIVFPILICLALILNCLALYLFRRKKLAALSENRYLQFLSGVNILCALTTIPATILKNHCPFTSFSSAFYYTYFGWTMVFLLRNLSICSLVWMSYDRFLYIWSLSLFQKLMQPAVVKKRLISTAIVIILAFLPIIFLGKVKNCNEVSPTCDENEEGKWLSFAGYRRDMDDTWFAILFIFLVQGTIHIILIILTISLFTGLKQKIFKRRKRQVDQTIALIINNISYLIVDVTYVITAIFFYKYKYDQGHCYNTFSRERWMATVNCLHMFWSSFSILIFMLQSKVYRNQLMSILFQCYTWDTDEKVRNSVRQSIQLQRQSIQLQRQSIQLQQMKIPEVTQL